MFYYVLNVTIPIIPREKKKIFASQAAKIGGNISEYPKEREME